MGMYTDIHELYGGASATKGVFAVPAANLGFSIVAFCCACLGALLLLVLRRRVVVGELGGPYQIKVATALTLVLYWAGYVFIVSWRALRYEQASVTEEVLVISSVLLVEWLISIWPMSL